MVFSRSATAESSGKKIFCRKKQNRKTVESFIQRTIHLASHADLPWYLSDELSQTGETFGEKITGAIVQTLAKGYRKLIIIGNDCPGLTQNVLQKALSDLEHHDWVLGPTSKGGVYLIGLSAWSFDKAAFEKISWQTTAVFANLQMIITETGFKYSCLQTFDDINTQKDVISFANKISSNNSLLRLLLNFFTASTFKHYNYVIQILFAHRCSINRRRGPPVRFAFPIYKDIYRYCFL